MKRRIQTDSPGGRMICYKLDPGVFVVEVPDIGRKISLGQPPDAIKRFQQVGYIGRNGIKTFVVVDSKRQGESISWNLVEFPILYALYFIPAEKNGVTVPSFYAGIRPQLAGLEKDVQQSMRMIKYGNYGVDSVDEFDAMDIPDATRDAMRKEILGLAVDNKILDSDVFMDPVYLDPNPRNESEFSDLGDGISIGKIGRNTYRFLYKDDSLDVEVTLLPGEKFRSPVEYKHLKFPVNNFGIWHTGEYDGMDPYHSAAHTSIIHKYSPILIDYPANMTSIITHHGLSQQSVNTLLITHNHDDHTGALVELFRRSSRCHIITTAPVMFSLVRKVAALVDLPERMVQDNFVWTLLPFRKDNPFRTEELNLEGVRITGHMSCHSVPTTLFTMAVNQDGLDYTYGHFMDIVAFKRMKMLQKDGWMPREHLEYLDQVIRKTKYNLVKYDVGCISDSSLPFTVHGQWQDLKGAATEKAFRVFSHATRSELDPSYENEGRFVSIGDLDSTIRTKGGKIVRLGGGNNSTTAFFSRSREVARAYFQSMMDIRHGSPQGRLMDHYATAFANCPKLPDPNIGTFIFEQGSPSNSVAIIVKGRVEVLLHDEQGNLLSRSTAGDGEVVGDFDVLSGQNRTASMKSLNRISYISVPSNLFKEAMEAIGITYDGDFKAMFNRRMLFQRVHLATQDLSSLVLNRIARNSESRTVEKGGELFKKGAKDTCFYVSTGPVEVLIGKNKEVLPGPALLGECEFLGLASSGKTVPRKFTVLAKKKMEVLSLDFQAFTDVPVLVDNVRRLVRDRRQTVYSDLPEILPGHGL